MLYALRDVTATVDQLSLIAASIMSKKLAAGAQAIVLDVKVGDGAFMKTLDDARHLAETMLALGEQAGREVVCLLTDMDQPLGAAVGNALEVIEARATVRGEGPPDFTELVLDACARLLELSDLGIELRRGLPLAERAIADGSAEEMWCRWIEAQGGTADESALERAPVVREVTAPASGARRRSSARSRVGNAALHLGAGRRTKDDEIDHAVGVVCHAKRGDEVEAGEVLAEVHARTDAAADEAAARGARGVRARDEPPAGAARPARGPRLSRRRLPWRDARAARGRDGSAALAPVLEGRRFERVRIDDVRLTLPLDPAGVARRLEGERVAHVDRRGKYLMLRFESGRALLVHLRMTGSFRHAAGGKLDDDAYRRAIARSTTGRRSATATCGGSARGCCSSRTRSSRTSTPGSAPSRSTPAFTPRAPRGAAREAAGADQGRDPRPAHRRGRREHLRRRGALARPRPSAARGAQPRSRRDPRAAPERSAARSRSGSRARGRRSRDYRQPNGAPGGMQDEFKVYGRAGEPCDRCGTPIERIVVAGRGTSYCPSCQVSPYADPSTASRRPSRSRRTSSV